MQAMQMSNGLTNPAGLWLGHLMWDLIVVLIAASAIVGTLPTSKMVFHEYGLFVSLPTAPYCRLTFIFVGLPPILVACISIIWDCFGALGILLFVAYIIPSGCICWNGELPSYHVFGELDFLRYFHNPSNSKLISIRFH